MSITIKPEHEATVLKIREIKKGTATEIGAPPAVVAKLTRDGVIESVGTKKGSRGRPANLYALTAEGRKAAGLVARKRK
jgi:predicted transcriptional regulator